MYQKMHTFIGALATILPLAAGAPSSLAPVARGSSTPGCTSASFANFSWTIEAFTFHGQNVYTTPAHLNPYGTVNFNLSNPALGEDVKCSASSSAITDFFYFGITYTCTSPTGSTAKTYFDYNRPTGTVDINQTWSCTDDVYPVTFTALGSVNLTLACQTTFYTNPNWQPGTGAIYSEQDTNCTPLTLPLTPYKKVAV
ncbi:hypothetical protein GGS24DRAFT_211283 [Hypoxylon argillaceum]|nr:hypothetical protein GGS24DRAFT_211283 [Hypoxylon argillaceum]